MDASIISAIITAIASIAVALISKGSPTSSRPIPQPELLSKNGAAWTLGFFAFLAWLLFASAFLHHDLAGSSWMLIPIWTIILAFFFPVRPWRAAATAMMMFPFAYATEPFAHWLRGGLVNSRTEFDLVAMYVGTALVTAALVAMICRSRLKSKLLEQPVEDEEASADEKGPTGQLAAELLELSELHSSGVLSDEEFAKAKDKLLS